MERLGGVCSKRIRSKAIQIAREQHFWFQTQRETEAGLEVKKKKRRPLPKQTTRTGGKSSLERKDIDKRRAVGGRVITLIMDGTMV